MKPEINFQTERAKKYGKFIRRQSHRILNLIRKTEGNSLAGPRRISLVLVDNRYISRLNRLYLDKNRPTDVLAFVYPEALPGELGGECFISFTQAREQSRRFKHSLEDELTLLLTHGFLHLFGYSDRGQDRIRMRRKEQEICRNLI